MYLVLVESPAKTKTLEKFLGKEYKALASYGHLRDLPKSELGVDVENNFKPKYIIPKKVLKNIKPLKEAVKKADLVYLATDPDREGEAISYHLLHALDIKKYKRITFNEITKTAVQEAIKKPKDIDMNLVDAQQARRVLDRLVGYNLSPLLWKKLYYGLSAGRVQSVALKMVTDREKEINSFKEEEFWSIAALLKCKEGEFSADLREKNKKKIGKMDIKNKEAAETIKKELEQGVFSVQKIEAKEKKKHPLPPFTTSTMQQEAFKKLKFPSKFTMGLAQSLYEKGLITYHRTDSLNIANSAKKETENFIAKAYGEKYASPKNFASKGKTQEAHEAVRPSITEKTPDKTNRLKKEELRLYDLIWRRFVASQMSPAVFNSTSVKIGAKSKNDYILNANGSVLKFDGFLRVYKTNFDENVLPVVKEEEILSLKKIKPEQHFTAPPPRYTEATLIKEMEKHGVGRPSTYAPTLSTISERNYVEKTDKKQLKPTEIGCVVSDLLAQHFPNIVDFKFTAKMEEDLDIIAKGEKDWQKVMKDFYDDFAKNLAKKQLEIKKGNIMQEKTDKKCNKCGSDMEVKFGKFGKFIACTNFPDCKNTQPLEDDKEKSGEKEPDKEIKCDKCGKEMTVKKSKFGEFYGCSGYPDCKNIRSLNEDDSEKENKKPIKCDKCDGEMQVKRGRFGEFYGCSNYPDCKNIKSMDEDLDIKCPDCGTGDVVKKVSKRGPFYACSSYPNCKFTSKDKPKQ